MIVDYSAEIKIASTVGGVIICIVVQDMVDRGHRVQWRFFYRATAVLSVVYAVVVCLSVCVCVWSVTLRYCIKTAKRRIRK